MPATHAIQNNPLRRMFSDRKGGFKVHGGDNKRARQWLENRGGTFGNHSSPLRSTTNGYVCFGRVGKGNSEIVDHWVELDTNTLGFLAIETGAAALRFPRGLITCDQPYNYYAPKGWFEALYSGSASRRQTVLLSFIPPESIERALAGEKEDDHPGHRIDPRVLGITLNFNASKKDAVELARLPMESLRWCLQDLFENPPEGEAGRAIDWIHEGFIKPAPNGLNSFECIDPQNGNWIADIKRRLYS